MPVSLSKSLPLPPSLRMDEECKPKSEKRGIVTILGSISETDTPRTASLRRTLSADMSSKKWMEQNGLKKTASSQEFLVSSTVEDSSSSSSEEEYDEEERKHIWNSIQHAKRIETTGCRNPGRFDTWGSILTSQKDEAAKSLPPPYVHPLVKKSSSILSKKSLEICTESLGSETGSDGFSSYHSSEAGDTDEDTNSEEQQQEGERQDYVFDREEAQVAAKYNYLASKKVQPRAFPPPLASLNKQNGVSLWVRSRRDNGRLVLEAVTVSSPNNFQAQRQDGRLVLTFANRIGSDEELESDGRAMEEEEEEEIIGSYEEETMDFDGENEEVKVEEEEEIKEVEVEVEKVDTKSGVDNVEVSMERPPKKMSSGVIDVHKLAFLFNKPIGLPNGNPTWANNFNEEAKEGKKTSLSPRVAARMIPTPPPTMAAKPLIAASSFNTYEYFWRTKSMETPIMKPIAQQPLKSYSNKFMTPKMLLPNEPHETLATGGEKAAYLGPLLKSCNEPRRSLFIWEPNCIATST